MSTSPFEIFRRNLKPLMVLLTALALFAFVVLPVMDTYMRRNAGLAGDEVVAAFDNTQVTRNRVDYFTRTHQATVRFLVELAEETMRRGGVPKTAGFSADGQVNPPRVTAIGINESPSYMGSIRTLMLAAEAQKDGFALDDTALQFWLTQYTDEKIPDGEINALLMSSTQNQMGRPHLYEQLRSHLLARLYEERGLTGLFLGRSPMSGPLMTPEEQWSNFQKLNRSAVASAYGVLVNDYLPMTNENPSEDEIKEIYEEGKDRDPNDQSPDPAFHRRYSAAFEFVSADFQQFLDEEVAGLEEAVIRAEYEKRLLGGEFQLPESSAPNTDAEIDIEIDEKVDPADASAESTEATSDEDASSTSEADEPEQSSDSVNAESSDTESPTSESDADKSDSAEESESPDESDQSQNDSERSVRLVSAFQEETAAQSEQQADESSEGADESSEGKDQADDSSETGDDAKEGEGEQEASETESESKAGDDGEETSDGTPSAEVPQRADGGDADESAARVESFEDVRKQVAEAMVAEAAREKMDAAISTVTNRMQLYFDEKQINDTPPKRPDLQSLANELGLQYETIGPYDAATIRDEPIAGSMDIGSQFSGQAANFVQLMFGAVGAQNDAPTQPLFAPIQTADGPAGKLYVAWKTEETPAYTPSLDEVRGEVVLAVRMQEARKMAREAAEKLIAGAAAKDDTSIKDLVPTDKIDNLKEGLGPFTWMNSFGFSGATIGNVPELDSVGNEFMESVFTADVGQMKVAENQSGRVVYIVQPDAFQPSLEELKLQFKQPTNRMMAMFLGNGAAPIINEFFEQMDEEAKFKDYTGEEQ